MFNAFGAKKLRHVSYVLSILIALALLLPASPSQSAFAVADNVLTIDYNSGTELKFVTTGPLLSPDQERVYTESELKQRFASDKDNGDLYYFTSLNTFGTKRAYTVRGVSLWDVFADAGIGTDIYRNGNNFLITVGADGMANAMGPDVIFIGQYGQVPAGTIDQPRYTYPLGDFLNDNGSNGMEIPWVIGFAEKYNAVTSPATVFPDDATDSNQALRPYFGQLDVTGVNNPFFNNCTYRINFAPVQLSPNDARNNSTSLVFDLLGTQYDRARIMTGSPYNGQDISGEKIRGHFESAGEVTYFEGTDVASLLYTGIEWQYIDGAWVEVPPYLIGEEDSVLFVNAAGEQAVASFAELMSGDYVLAYTAGSSADNVTAIERNVDGTEYYFDLYRDGYPVVQNVSGIVLYEGPSLVDVSWYNADDTVFEIETAEQLRGLAAIVNNKPAGSAAGAVEGIDQNLPADDFLGKTINLTADVDMGGVEVSPGWLDGASYALPVWEGLEFTTIANGTSSTTSNNGERGRPFKGTFDGGFHAISNIYVPYGSGPADSDITNSHALFGDLGPEGTVMNVIIKSGFISGSRYTGGVVGRNWGHVENCANYATVDGNYGRSGGGLAGINFRNNTAYTPWVKDSFNAGLIFKGDQYNLGGIVGDSNEGLVDNCYNVGNGIFKGTISSSTTMQGIVGGSRAAGTVTNCFSLAGEGMPTTIVNNTVPASNGIVSAAEMKDLASASLAKPLYDSLAEILNELIEEPEPAWVGDATEETALLKITGVVEKPGYFSQDGLKAYSDFVQTITYSHLNSFPTFGTTTVTGIYLEDLLDSIMTMDQDAESVTLRSSDNMSATFKLNDEPLGVYATDIEGHKMMLYFDGANLRLAVGQAYEGHVNYGMWMKYVVSITVNAAEPVVVDKGALAALVEDAGNLDESAYTAESWAVFAMALSAANIVLADEAAAQTDVDAAYEALTEAITGLTAAHVHAYDQVVTAPTCTEQGYTTYTCTCGDSYVSDYVPALGHDFTVQVEQVDASCTDSGYTVFKCSRCDETDTVIIPATGHNWNTGVVTAPTCTEQGYTTYTCSNCGATRVENYLDALGHDWNAGVVTVPATEYNDGVMTFTCNRCGETRIETIPAIGHSHNYTPAVTAPTCTEQGYTTYTCTCGDSYVSDYVPALGHDFTVQVEQVDATCTDSGYTVFKCSRCDETDTVIIPATGHNWNTGVVTAPTCTEQGYTTYTCSNCGATKVEDYVTALGHDWNAGVVTVPATEYEDGEMTYTCNRCGETRTEPISAIGHNHNYTAAVTAPTCTEQGYTTYTCSCGDSYVSDYVPALGHDFTVQMEQVDATCTDSGYIVFKCSRCDETDTVIIPATGHDWNTGAVTAPTCTEQGYTTYTCSNCGATKVENYVAALGHDFVLVSHQDATSVNDGYDYYECSRCDETKTVIIPATGVEFVGEPVEIGNNDTDAEFKLNAEFADLDEISLIIGGYSFPLQLVRDGEGNFLLYNYELFGDEPVGIAVAGSIIVTLFSDFLATLENGDYVLKVTLVMDGGEPYAAPETTFTIDRSSSGEVNLVSATPSAFVNKLNGNKNDLTITVTELYSDGSGKTVSETISINNNAAGTYKVGDYSVYVDTKGNTQIRECYIVR